MYLHVLKIATFYDILCETFLWNLNIFALLVLAGFGNLHGNIEIWDLQAKKLISNPKAPDSTSFEWSPDGEHILTATTAPRLRVGNGLAVVYICNWDNFTCDDY